MELFSSGIGPFLCFHCPFHRCNCAPRAPVPAFVQTKREGGFSAGATKTPKVRGGFELAPPASKTEPLLEMNLFILKTERRF